MKVFIRLTSVIFCYCMALIVTPHINAENQAAVDCQLPSIECVEGIQSGNASWTADKVYVLTDDYTVPSTGTLTITSGTVIKAKDAADLIIEGTLNAEGKPDSLIYITSEKDDSIGGDTNQDGDSSTPAADDWDNIQFLGGDGILSYVEIRYAGGNPTASADDGAIFLQNSSPTITNVTIKSAQRAAISAASTDAPIISNLLIEDTPFAGIEIRPGEVTSNTTWSITEAIYILDDDLTIASGSTLRMDAGITVKLDDAADINVKGVLNAIGTSERPITFTSIKNDAVGGDTNGDGTSSIPAIDDWDSIIFEEGSTGLLSYVDISYSGGDNDTDGAIHVKNSSPTITNCLLSNNQIGIYSTGDTNTPIVNGCDLFSNKDFGIFNASEVAVLNALNNWWGSNQGPNDSSEDDGNSNFSSRGENVSDYVNYSPWSESRTQPTLSVDISDITFNATQNGNNPGEQFIEVLNLGEGVLSWTASEDIPWLSLGQGAGETPTILPVTVDIDGLEAGAYSGSFEISSPTARLSPQRIDVKLTVVTTADANPIIEVSSNALAFNVAFAGREGAVNPEPQSIYIRNSGTGTLNWSAIEDIPWLALDQTSGVAQSIVSASVDIAGIEEGTYRGDFRIESTEAQNSPALIQVLLVIGCINVKPVDVMLVVDRSASMAEPDISTFENAKIAANLFIDQVDLITNQLGFVTFYGVASLESRLSVNGNQIKEYVTDLTVDNGNNPQSGTNIEAAINTAQRELESARHRTNSQPIIVLLSDGEANRGGNPVDAARAAKANGTRIITIGLGEVDETTLKAIASSESDYYPAPTSADLIEIYSSISVNIGCPNEIYLPMIVR